MANKRGQGEGTISKRADGTWWARITLGKDENGKQKRKAFYGKTRKEVQKKLTEAIAEYDNGMYIDPSRMTLAEWMDNWIKNYKRLDIAPGPRIMPWRTRTPRIFGLACGVTRAKTAWS